MVGFGDGCGRGDNNGDPRGTGNGYDRGMDNYAYGITNNNNTTKS